MNLCIPVESDEGLNSRVCAHFGSAPAFLIVELETEPLAIAEEGEVELGDMAAATAAHPQVRESRALHLVRAESVERAAQALGVPLAPLRVAEELREREGVRLVYVGHDLEAAADQRAQLRVDVRTDEPEPEIEVLFREDVLVVFRKQDVSVPLTIRHCLLHSRGTGGAVLASRRAQRSAGMPTSSWFAAT